MTASALARTGRPISRSSTSPSLRAIPNLWVFRPADAIETAECWELALRRQDGPSVLALSRQNLPALRDDDDENLCRRGAYRLISREAELKVVILATGSEVQLARRDRRGARGRRHRRRCRFDALLGTVRAAGR